MITYRVLGQSIPAATTLTTLYTCPAATSTVVSSLTVCNQAAVAATFRFAVRPAGAAIAGQHYIGYDAVLQPNDIQAFNIGITLAATDVVSVQSSTATTSFSLFGAENS